MEKRMKLFQYVMLAVLLAAAVFLPPLAAGKMAGGEKGQETAEGETKGAEEEQEEIREDRGTIVIDAGHGGCKLRRASGRNCSGRGEGQYGRER